MEDTKLDPGCQPQPCPGEQWGCVVMFVAFCAMVAFIFWTLM